jgi:Uncharacterized protein conserved in bacteria (DUF2188)
MSTLHVMPDARGRWRVVEEDEERTELSQYTTADAAERDAWRRGAGSVLVHDRYDRIHSARRLTEALTPSR